MANSEKVECSFGAELHSRDALAVAHWIQWHSGYSGTVDTVAHWHWHGGTLAHWQSESFTGEKSEERLAFQVLNHQTEFYKKLF